MNHKTDSVVKYMGAAMAVGGTVMLGVGLANKDASLKKKVKKTAFRAIDAMDAVLTNVQHYMK